MSNIFKEISTRLGMIKHVIKDTNVVVLSMKRIKKKEAKIAFSMSKVLQDAAYPPFLAGSSQYLADLAQETSDKQREMKDKGFVVTATVLNREDEK